MVDTKDSVDPHAVTYLPTPTQAENDLAAIGEVPPVKEYDGSPIDPASNNPAVPQPPGSPAISSISPTTGALPNAPIALQVNGSGFTAAAKVNFNQSAVATMFVSATELTCSVTADAAGTYPVEVEDTGGFSNSVQFTFTATAELAESPSPNPVTRPSRRAASTREQER